MVESGGTFDRTARRIYGRCSWRDVAPRRVWPPDRDAPGSRKSYAGDAIISTLWDEFSEAIRRARRVVVLGHSIHDRAIVEVLRTAPALAIFGLADAEQPDQFDAAAEPLLEIVKRDLPHATTVPIRFDGHHSVHGPALDHWLDQH